MPAPDLATLSLTLNNAQMNAGAKQTGDVLEQMGVKGQTAAGAIERAIARQNTQMQQTANITIGSTRNMGAYSALQAEAAGHVGEHSLALGRLERSLGDVAVRTLGLNPQLALLTESLGKFALGSVEMVAILAGAAAISYVWGKMTADAKAADEEHAKFMKTLGGLANDSDAAKINTAGRTLLYGQPFDDKGNLVGNSALVAGAFKGSIADMEARYDALMAKIPRGATMASGAIAGEINDLVAKLDPALKKFHELQDAANNLANQPAGTPGQLQKTTIKAQSDEQILSDQKKLVDAGNALEDAGAEHLKKTLALVRDYQQHLRDDNLAAEKKAQDDLAKASEEAAKRDQEAVKREIEQETRERQQQTDDMARTFARVFEDIRTKGTASFRQLFDDIGSMFAKLAEEMLAKDLARAAMGVLTGGASGGLTNSGVLAASAQKLLPAIGVGAGVGYGVGSATGSTAAGMLSGAASGAMMGFATAGPVGAIIGGAAGLVGGFLGAQHGAEAAAKALLQIQTNETQAAATLADWRAQITGLASDQKNAALLDIKMKYLSVEAQINQLEAGKKMEEQRNKDLAEATNDFNLAMVRAANNITGAFTSAVNAVQGYKLQQAIFAAAAPYAPGGGSGAGGNSGSTSGAGGTSGGGDTTVTLVMDGVAVAKGVIKNAKSIANKKTGTTMNWATVV